MDWVEKLKSTIENVRSAADSVGKTLWIFLGVFVAAAIATGHPSLLGAIRDRLILAGVTSLKTPFGEIDPKQIGQTDTTSRILGVNAARAGELAKKARDEETKRELEEIAKQLKEQQHVQIEALNNFATKQKIDSGPRLANESADAEGWVYLGRRSGDHWRPPSFSIDEPAYPVKSGTTLVIKSDTLLYGVVDCKVIDASDFKSTSVPQSLVFVTASPKEIQVSAEPTECSSIGGAKTVWAKVKVPAARLLRAKQ